MGMFVYSVCSTRNIVWQVSHEGNTINVQGIICVKLAMASVVKSHMHFHCKTNDLLSFCVLSLPSCKTWSSCTDETQLMAVYVIPLPVMQLACGFAAVKEKNG